MKYWVYKESRILGPFEKEAVSGLPGLDSGTLVCAGDPAGNSWMPAGELAELSVVSSGGAGPLEDLPSSVGLLDQLQIDCAGLVGDDEFPGAFAEELFRDASFKRGFGDALSARAPSDEAEARRAHDKIAELTAQLEAMSRRVSELEAGRTDLAHRLAQKEKDLELRSRGDAALPIDPVAAVPEKSIPSAEGPPAPVPPPPAPLEPPPAPEPAAAPKTLSFNKPKSFQIAPTVRSFKVLGADEDAPETVPNPAPEFKVEPVLETPAPVAAAPEPPQPAAPILPETAPAPAPLPIPIMELVTPPFTLPERPQPPIPTPSSPPPNTLYRSQPAPDPVLAEPIGPSLTASGKGSSPFDELVASADAAADASVAARFAKPEPAPLTGEVKKRGRSNKAFLIIGGALVTLLLILGVIFMRQPKEDLKQMTTLDDGKAPIGLPADDGAAAQSRPESNPKRSHGRCHKGHAPSPQRLQGPGCGSARCCWLPPSSAPGSIARTSTRGNIDRSPIASLQVEARLSLNIRQEPRLPRIASLPAIESLPGYQSGCSSAKRRKNQELSSRHLRRSTKIERSSQSPDP